MFRKKFFTWLKLVFEYSSYIFFVIAAGSWIMQKHYYPQHRGP